MDRLTPEKRSWNMSRIKSKDTTPERIVRSFLHRNGFRFRLHVKDLPGKPDIVLPKYKTVIEVRGCYWHRHEGCKDATTPSTNTEFWKNKFAATVARDKRTEQELKASGWKLIVLWECEIINKTFPKLLNMNIGNMEQKNESSVTDDRDNIAFLRIIAL